MHRVHTVLDIGHQEVISGTGRIWAQPLLFKGLEHCGSGSPHGVLDLIPFDTKGQLYIVSKKQK